ncbi:MAG: hypothetical protein HOK80_10810 [Candidatus Cloacimonetes bacterium]|jgi:hypothetical protein|nr:hypothetical protein [Candidatus Cloacimonadota bacterium]
MNENKGRTLAIWGLTLQFGFVVGIAGTVIGVMRAFGQMATSGSREKLSFQRSAREDGIPLDRRTDCGTVRGV